MDLFLIVAACLYLIGLMLGVAKGYGIQRVSDDLRHKLINIAFIWHTVMIIFVAWQLQNYFFIVPPYEQIVTAWFIVFLYMLWTKKYNLLILEIYILSSAFFMIVPVIFMIKLSPELISTEWLKGGGVFKHLFLVSAVALLINTILLDLAFAKEVKYKKISYYGYRVGLLLWLFALGFYYYWLTRLQDLTGGSFGQLNNLWIFSLTIFLIFYLYFKRLQEIKPKVDYSKTIKIISLFVLISLFAVTFGL